jgi:hypothetical protein
MGYQEPQQLLQSQENKACGQQEPWDLLAGTGYQEAGSCTGMGDPSLEAAGVLGPACQVPQELL